MTREEAIKIIKNYEVLGCGYCHQGGEEIEQAFRMAIEALKERPHITDEQISDAFQVAIVNYWEAKSKYLTPPPSPCCDFKNKMVHGEWKTESAIDYLTEIGWLPEHDRILTERPHGNWEYLKEHITEMRDADGELDQKQTCHFILNLMGVIEKEGEAEEIKDTPSTTGTS